MTQEHLTDQQVEAYRQRELDVSGRNALASHLAACEACLRRVVDAAHFNVAFASLKESFLARADEEPFHLSREELKRYTEGRMDQPDRTIFESHLEDCAECRKLAQDLVLVSPMIATQEGSRQPASTTETAWKRFVDSWRRSPSLRPVYLGVIALVIVCAALLVFLIQSKSSGGRDQVSSPQTVNSGSQAQSQPAPTQQTNPPGGETVSDNVQTVKTKPPDDRGALPSLQPPRPTTEIIVSLIDGNSEVTLDRQGNVTGLEGMSGPVLEAVRQALSAKGIKKPQALNELSAPRITFLGQASDSVPFALNAPIGLVSLSDRPAFSWQPLSGATNYTVSVFDSNFNRVLRSEPLAATNWSATATLKRGRMYFWEVTAIKDDQEITSPVAPAPRAQFKIVDEETAREINQVRSAHTDSHLALGILYARAGLLDDAEREFQLLLNANPGSEIARTFLNRVRSWKRQ
jgi:anti-sigma factor RsiW